MVRRRPQTADDRPRFVTLAIPSDKKEFLDTPAPYYWEDTRDNRRIPYVFRTCPRFPPGAAPLRDALDCDRTVVEPKPQVPVISDAPRWPTDKPQPVRLYDVQRGLQATERAVFSATFSSSSPRPALMPASDHIPSQTHLTIANSKTPGGRFSNQLRRTEECMLLTSSSPGPIYQPSFAQVDRKSETAVFSSQPREPKVNSVGPGPLAYADSVAQRDLLSTARRPPSACISDVPNSSSMPFPYDMSNVCNSRSMRTAFCESHVSRTRVLSVSDTRPQSALSTNAPRATSPHPSLASTSKTHDESVMKHVMRTRAATPISTGRVSPWQAPFRGGTGAAFVRQVDVVVNPIADEGAAVPLAHAPYIRKSAVSSAPPALVHMEPPLPRFAFAKKFPHFTSAAVQADGAMAVLIAEARKVHPESVRRSNTRHPWESASSIR
jgi:hypothetical protein